MLPGERLATLSWREVEFVVAGGVVRLASEDVLDRLPPKMREGLEALSVDGVTRWLRAPVRALFHAASEVLGDTGLSLNGRQLSLAGDRDA
jgi:hypothetical protein